MSYPLVPKPGPRDYAAIGAFVLASFCLGGVSASAMAGSFRYVAFWSALATTVFVLALVFVPGAEDDD